MNSPDRSGPRGVSHCFIIPALAAAIAHAPAHASDRPVIDGVMSEWTPGMVIATDPAGDAAGPLDVLDLSAQSRGGVLYLRLGIANARNLAAGPAGEGTLVIRVTAAGSGRFVEIDLRTRAARIDGAGVPYAAVDFVSLPTTASVTHEMRLDLAAIGLSEGAGVTVTITGADTLAAPAPFTLSGAALPIITRPSARRACTDLRIASLNTFVDGLLSQTRVPRLSRLLDAVNADVYVFQEEYSSSAPAVQAVLNAADPLDNGVPWNVLKSGELAIASPYPMIPLAMNARFYGAVVRKPGGPDVLVVSVHPFCCGFAGSSEDTNRINLSQTAITVFNNFRAGLAGSALLPYKDAPAVVLGDWNLVGSSTPLDLWLTPNAPGMTRLRPMHLVGDDAWTWNAAPTAAPGQFWPGVLDLTIYSPPTAARDGLFPKNTFLLNTARVPAAELAALGLLADDSAASDHLLMIADFGRLPSANIDAEPELGLGDFFFFLNAFDAGDPAADIDGLPGVDLADFFAFLNAFDASCD